MSKADQLTADSEYLVLLASMMRRANLIGSPTGRGVSTKISPELAEDIAEKLTDIAGRMKGEATNEQA